MKGRFYQIYVSLAMFDESETWFLTKMRRQFREELRRQWLEQRVVLKLIEKRSSLELKKFAAFGRNFRQTSQIPGNAMVRIGQCSPSPFEALQITHFEKVRKIL